MTCCCFPPFCWRPSNGARNISNLDGQPKAPSCEFLSRLCNNIINNQKLSLTIGVIAVLLGVLGLIGTVGMLTPVSAFLITGGGVLMAKGLCDAVPNICGDHEDDEVRFTVKSQPVQTNDEDSDTNV